MKQFKHLLTFVLISLPLLATHAQGSKATEASDSISFDSIEEALKVLKAKSGVTFRAQDGWTVAEDKAAFVTWLITPLGHPAYPSIVKRAVVNRTDGAHMETNIRCFATKEVCDKYFGSK